MKRLLVLFLLILGCMPKAARAENIRDLVTIVNVFPVQLEGFGVVAGLSGKGDKSKGALKAIRNYMERLGMPVNENDLATGNLAYVRVAATVPPWTTAGTFIDARVSAINGSTDLTNGELMTTDLFSGHGKNSEPFARVMGKLVVNRGNLVNALIPAGRGAGAQVLVAKPELPVVDGMLVLALNRPNAADSAAIARAINLSSLNPYRKDAYGYDAGDVADREKIAWALGLGQVQVRLPRTYRTRETEFIADLFRLRIDLDRPPSIVYNQATGLFTMVGDVRIVQRGLVARRGKTVILAPPPPPGDPNARVYDLPDGTPRNLVELGGHNTEVELQQLISTLNAMGMDSDEVADIFCRLREQGAIRAELIRE